MTVTIQWDADAPLTAQPDAGSANKVYTVAGAGTVTITDEAIGGESRTLNYTVPLGLTTVVPTPATVDSAGDEAARTISVAGDGFPASMNGTVAIATGVPGAYGTTVVAVGAVTNASGVFTGVSVVVPADTDAGDYHLEVTFGDIADLSAALTVTNTGLAAPTNLASPSQTANAVELTWTAVPESEAYVVEWKTTADTEWTPREPVAAPTVTDTVPGLTPGTPYDFRVKATATGSTDSPYSTVFSVTTPAQPQLATPTALAAGTTTQNSVPLSWNAVTDTQTYTVAWRELAGAWTEIPGIALTSRTVADLQPLTDYEFRVKAVADGFTDSEWSTVESATTQSLGTLTTPTAAAGTITATSVEVTWGAITDAEQYVVRWDESGQTAWNERTAVAAPATSDTVEALTTSQSYDFQVQARATGWTPSAWSATVTATPA